MNNNYINNFLNEIENICKKYNLSISHEDSHGGFIIENYDDDNIKWLKDATDHSSCIEHYDLNDIISDEENKAIEDLKRLKKGIEFLNQITPEKDDVDIKAIDIVLNLVKKQHNEIKELKDEINEMWSHIPRLD